MHGRLRNSFGRLLLCFLGGAMETMIMASLDSVLGEPRGLWSSKEFSSQPTNLDKLLNYLISYSSSAATSRRAIRLFKGIDSSGLLAFSSWNEVRVSTLRDIQDVLICAGAKNDTWDLSITIKDFLQNLFDTFGYCDLDDFSEKELNSYLDQLQGRPASWKGETVPFRPAYATWTRKNARVVGELVLPEPALMYLKFLLGKTKYAPFDYHSEKVLMRLGLITPEMSYQDKRSVYNQLIGNEKPVSKHRKIVEFSKLVCLKREPRCGICPLKNSCHYNQKKP